mgnify:CR=1 FL=1
MTECMICFDPLSSHVAFELSCGHSTFHGRCIVEWFLNSDEHQCPVCRHEVEQYRPRHLLVLNAPMLPTSDAVSCVFCRTPVGTSSSNIDQVNGCQRCGRLVHQFCIPEADETTTTATATEDNSAETVPDVPPQSTDTLKTMGNSAFKEGDLKGAIQVRTCGIGRVFIHWWSYNCCFISLNFVMASTGMAEQRMRMHMCLWCRIASHRIASVGRISETLL